MYTKVESTNAKYKITLLYKCRNVMLSGVRILCYVNSDISINANITKIKSAKERPDRAKPA